MTRFARLGVVLAALLQFGCSQHRTSKVPERAEAPRISNVEYVDLKAGGTVRVVVPILRSGGYVVPSIKKSAGVTGEIAVGDDFLGYETGYYKLVSRRHGGIRIRFSYAEVWRQSKKSKLNKPLLPIFEGAQRGRHIRLVYLVRQSKADHNMAIVAAQDAVTLDQLTRAVTQRAECRSSEAASCTWVPEGVAVIPD